MKRVKDVMSRKVICLDKKCTISNIAKVMDENGIGSVLITENGKAAGIITERDVITKCVAKGKDPAKASAESVMTTPLVSVDQDCLVDDAAKLMVSKMIRRLPIIDNGDIIGMVTATDLIRNIAQKGRKEDSLVYIVLDYEKF
jgi:signal-transduction protein with cAMP-binding, CBS, and nucleotidyltransferase domain